MLLVLLVLLVLLELPPVERSVPGWAPSVEKSVWGGVRTGRQASWRSEGGGPVRPLKFII